MEPQHKKLLNRRRVALLDGLRLEPVLQAMEHAKLLDQSEIAQILESSANPKHRVATFLDKLKRSGPTAFPALLNVLRTGQPHLADLLSVDPGEDEAWSNPTSKSSSRQASHDDVHRAVKPPDVLEHLETLHPGGVEVGWSRHSPYSPGEEASSHLGPISPPKLAGVQEASLQLFPTSKLPATERGELCMLLDRRHPFGDDWRGLYVALDLPKEKMHIIEESWDGASGAAESPTEQTLFVWQSREGDRVATVAALLAALKKISRQDAIDIIASLEIC